MMPERVMEKDIRAIWRQTAIPVVYRERKGKPLMLRLPYREDNYDWLRNERRIRPVWIPSGKYWQLPAAWFNDLITRSLQRFGRIYVIQPYREQEKCARACWEAKGFDCECSCMGKHHGSEYAGRGWLEISETFATRWNERQLSCSLMYVGFLILIHCGLPSDSYRRPPCFATILSKSLSQVRVEFRESSGIARRAEARKDCEKR
jgi:hypothetical protein